MTFPKHASSIVLPAVAALLFAGGVALLWGPPSEANDLVLPPVQGQTGTTDETGSRGLATDQAAQGSTATTSDDEASTHASASATASSGSSSASPGTGCNSHASATASASADGTNQYKHDEDSDQGNGCSAHASASATTQDGTSGD